MKYLKFFEDLSKELIKNNLCRFAGIKGCNLQEIKRLEDFYEIKLPESYKDFLQIMGNSCGELYCGTDFLYSELFFDLSKSNPVNLLKKEFKDFNIVEPNKRFFVFSIHQGYEYEFFFLDEYDDPTIKYFSESENACISTSELTFSKYIEIRINHQIKLYKNNFKLQ